MGERKRKSNFFNPKGSSLLAAPFFNISNIMNVIQNLLSLQAAITVSSNIPGMPADDRLLVAVPKDEAKTASGLIIPSGVKEDVPRKGVIVKFGNMDQEQSIIKSLEIGTIITFGLYAGKEVEFENRYKLEGTKFMVLSISEVIYIESNI